MEVFERHLACLRSTEHTGDCTMKTLRKYELLVQEHSAEWSLYVPLGLTFSNSTFRPHTVFMCSVCI
jgi:hypothetical protein